MTETALAVLQRNAKNEGWCPLCNRAEAKASLDEAGWLPSGVAERLQSEHPWWRRADGACPACVQQSLLQVLLEQGDESLHRAIQAVWPLDAEAAFGALPTPLRLHADPRFTGKGVTIALVDSAFYPHPDLVRPVNRIRCWVDATRDQLQEISFEASDEPVWPSWDSRSAAQWHGQMTSVATAGNGYLSHGFYRGLASDSDVALIQTMDEQGAIGNAAIRRALLWILEHHRVFGIRVVNLSLGGEEVGPGESNSVDDAVRELVESGVNVVVAAGNDGQRRLLPPGTAPQALTVGGVDDKNTFSHEEIELWHSNYGESVTGALKPELVAPSIWLTAPVVPGTELAVEAAQLFTRRRSGDRSCEQRIAQLKLITPHYQHVDGTSFAAPLVSGTVACMLEANPDLSPALVREILLGTAQPVPAASRERQGAGVLNPGLATGCALAEMHTAGINLKMPEIGAREVVFLLHQHSAEQIRLIGSWDYWSPPGIPFAIIEPGLWRARLPLPTPGTYFYKFLIDDQVWLDDPLNLHKAPDRLGGLNSVFEIADTV